MYRLHLEGDLLVLGIEDDTVDSEPGADDFECEQQSAGDSQCILDSYMQTLLRVNEMRKGVVDMRRTSALLADDLTGLEQSAHALNSGVRSLADDIQQFNHDLEVEYYLADMIQRLVRYGEQIKYVPHQYSCREFPAGTRTLKATTSLIARQSSRSRQPGTRLSQSDTTGLATKPNVSV